MLPLRLSFLFLFFVPLQLVSDQPVSNVLIYRDTVQVSSQINEFANVVEDQPIPVSIMVTHAENNPVDVNSFRMDNKSLKVDFVEIVPMASSGNLVISIYKFQLDGMKKGTHTAPPISVKVGGKEYASPPLVVRVAG